MGVFTLWAWEFWDDFKPVREYGFFTNVPDMEYFVFVLAFLRHSVMNVAIFNYKCSLTMMAPETFMPCIIYSLDFSKPSHNNNNKRRSIINIVTPHYY